MGNAHYAPTVHSRLSYFALDFKQNFMNDEVVVVYNLDEVVPIIKEAIRKYDAKGVSGEKRVSDNIMRIKLSNVMIRDFSDGKSYVYSQRCLCTIFADLLEFGWQLKAATNIRRADKRCTLFFYKDDCRSPPRSLGPMLTVCLKSSDKLYLGTAPPELVDVIRNEITRNWSKGIQNFENYGDYEFKFKFNGNPWLVHYFGQELNESRLLLISIMYTLSERGFQFYASSHPAGHEKAVDTIYFTRHEKPDPIGEAFIFGLLKTNELYLVRAPKEVVDMIRNLIHSLWKRGIESERSLGNLFVYKLHGSPWTASAEERKQARLLIVHAFEEMRRIGWKIHSTFDLSQVDDDVSCFMMAQCQPASNRFLAISLHGNRRLRLLNAPADIDTLFTDELCREWPEILKPRRKLDCAEMELPAVFSECIGIFCIVFDRLKQRGWHLVSSADLSANYQTQHDSQSNTTHTYPDDMHTLIFEHYTDATFAIGMEGFGAMKQ